MTALSELLTTANRSRRWSTREIASKAKSAGFSLGHDTAAKYLGGRHPQSPSEVTLQAWVAVFPELSIERLRKAADLPTEVTEIRLPEEASRLTPRQWDAVREVIRSMVNPGGASISESRDAEVVELPSRSASRAAARKTKRRASLQEDDST